MCMQCMATAITSGAAITGARSWLASRGFTWLTPRRLKRVTIGLIAAALLASSLVVTGSSPSTTAQAGAAPAGAAHTAPR